jgi:hypothetical protein
MITTGLRRGLCAVLAFAPSLLLAADLECVGWQQAHPNWLWCDDFESDASLEQNYFDVERADGRLRVSTDSAFGGNGSLRGTYISSSASAGSIKLSFGRTPVAQKRYTDRDFNEVYWRFYMKTSSNWTGNAFKVSRATVFSASNWSQAAIGHLWEDGESSLGMGIDPVSGVVGSQVVTTKYNDFANMTWLGKRNGPTQVYAAANRDKWTCVELRMKLNTPGQSDGVFAYWVNDNLEAQSTNLNWRGSYTGYGINAILMENYRSITAAQSQDRYLDNLVVSTQRIGCSATAQVRPNPPSDLRVN